VARLIPLEAEVFVALQRVADHLLRDMAKLLRAYGLSPAPYNVLRILRGATPAGLPCGEIGARLIQADPDVTRLLDRMEKQGWIERERGEHDRRVVIARITKTGLALVNKLDAPVNERHEATLGGLGKKRLAGLARELQSLHESFSAEGHPNNRYDDNR
jgi:DNA-binding MarR family transcriptional regulator